MCCTCCDRSLTNDHRQPLQEDVTLQLDNHLSVRLLQRTHELQLLFACDGAELAISQRHGPMLPGASGGGGGSSDGGGGSSSISSISNGGSSSNGGGGGDAAAGGSSSIAAATAGLPNGAELSGLMERARALMAAATAEAAATNVTVQAHHHQQQQLAEEESGHHHHQAPADQDDLQAMLARARAAVAAVECQL